MSNTSAGNSSDSDAWTQLGSYCCADEAACIDRLHALLDNSDSAQAAIAAQASVWITALRSAPPTAGIEALLLEYPLSSAEGIALMSLAEALLRIPEPKIADRLIRDLLNPIAWQQHLGHNDSQWVNAASWGLALSGRWLAFTEPTQQHFQSEHARVEHAGLAWLQRLTAQLGAPLLRRALLQAMRYMAEQFVLGENLPAALRRMPRDWSHNETHSLDMLGEAALTAADSERYISAYRSAIQQMALCQPPLTLARPSVSIKLSALHPRYQSQQWPRLQRELLPQLIALAEQAAAGGIDVTIDAEEADRWELTLQIFAQLMQSVAPPTRAHIGLVVQAYSKRALPSLFWLGELAARHATQLKIRLVKGAYWDSEIKRAQQRGLADYPVFTSKAATDISYLACAAWLLERPQLFFPQFATHNAATVAAILYRQPDLARCEFQRLHGMGAALYRSVRAQYPLLNCRIYAPVGEHRELLPYLVRRLLENGANTSFMHQLHDPAIAIDTLAAHPLQLWPPPTLPLPNPLQLWPARCNSRGIYLHNENERMQFFAELENYREHLYDEQPYDHPAAPQSVDDKNNVHSPYDNRAIGSWYATSATRLDAMATRARHEQYAWQLTTVDNRAACLEKYADLLFAARAELVVLMARETGKTLENGLDEVREAIDLCRYYAQQARLLLTEPTQLPGTTGEENRLSLIARGTFACISPWNFPLAIFSGQIAAALVTGNAVLAKPAEQATLTAQFAAALLHRAGVPPAIMQLLPGSGEIIGRQLCAHPHIDGIVFTGGWETARAIQQQVAQRDGAMIPFIAETAGLNTLIADSSAQPQQLVTDVIRSAFDSAGQRCSALRVLFLPERCADAIERLLCGALQQLSLGDPLSWSTDIGPIIDAEARQQLLDYIAIQRKLGAVIAQLPTPTSGLFVPPTLLRLHHLDELSREAFGPILHIIRYPEDALDAVVEQINISGYGLTCGIHSRNEQYALQLAQRLRVGNIYINRDIIGAVVEAQPFGGMGKSGTGPKAGGIHYLQRFTVEKAISINTSALGGDYRLLTK